MGRGLAVVLAIVIGAASAAVEACSGTGDSRPPASGDFGYAPQPGGNFGIPTPNDAGSTLPPGANQDAGGATTIDAGGAFGSVSAGIPGATGLGATGNGDQPGVGAVNSPSIPGAAGLGANGTGQVDGGTPTPDAGATGGVIVVF